ncbi:hypothetical protein, partial [Salmonella sp. s55044]|uniref:hypothetical protein n=1 Tax=Salmonella sp. s55044 TaxID=3159677 RepID=UPI003981301E
MLNVWKLDLLKIAPGGHVGRFCIWTDSAFRMLDYIYGTWKKPSQKKNGYNLPMPKMAVPDLKKLLTSPEIQGQSRPIQLDGTKKKTNKKT